MARPSLSAPLLPDHPPLLHLDKCGGERTAWVSSDLPAGMARSNGQWSLADFQLTKQLYKGKASTLYQALDRPSGTVVALKSYSKRRLSPLNWYQVEREVRLHAQLRHPNVLTLHAAFEDDNYVFLVCEFAEGGDLYEDLKRAGGQLKERVVAGEVLPAFMSALTYMHANSIIHRDIKPENILLAADRTIKVADFGLSINWGEERPVTRAGTLDYMSPEVLQCPEKSKPEENKERMELGYTDAVDVWAVGILAYELLVGRPPFERESREETYHYIQRKDPALPTWMTDPARDFILAALAKNARKRPSMGELLQHPWIRLHARRPSIPPPSSATSDLHLRLNELSPEGGQTFGELHRHSLHGAKSCRDFSSLLSATTAGPWALTNLLQPALSMAGPSSAAAASAALSSSSSTGVRPSTTTSRLGLGSTARPVTPVLPGQLHSMPSAQLSATLPGSAFPAGEASGSRTGSSSQHQEDTAGTGAGAGEPLAGTAGHSHSSSHAQEPQPGSVHHSHFSIQSSAAKQLSPSFNLHQAAAPAASSAAEPPSAFLELYKSMAPAVPERPGVVGAHTPRSGASRKGGSSNASIHRTNSGRSSNLSKGVEAALPPLQQQQQQQQQQQSDGASSSSPATHLVRLPSLRKALSVPVLHAEEALLTPSHAAAALPAAAAAAGSPAAPAAQAASEAAPAEAALHVVPGTEPAPERAATSRDVKHSALTVIPEQTNEAEPGSPMAEASRPDGGHLMLAGKPQQEAHSREDQAAATAEDRILAVHGHTPPPPQDAADGGSSEAGGSPMLSAEALAHNRMREAEQRHVDKLRARAASAVVLNSGGGAKERQPRKLSGPAHPTAQPIQGTSLAKSASSLFNKLLGRKRPDGSTSTAASMPAAVSHSGSSATRKASVDRLERSAISAAALVAAREAAAAGTPTKARTSLHMHSAPPPVHLTARAGPPTGQPSSPHSRPSQLHPTSGSPAARRPSAAAPKGAAAAGLEGTASGMQRSVVPGAARRPASSRVAPAPADSAAAAEPRAHLPAVLESIRGSGQSEEMVSRASSLSKSVRFAAGMAGRLGPAGPSGDFQDLIPAVHYTDSTSFTTAFSSLPASSLPSLTSGAASPLRASRKGSMSPPVSRKVSHIMPSASSRSLLARAPGGSMLLGGPGSGSGAGNVRPRGRIGKMASMPGEAKPAAGSSAAREEDEGEHDGVQRSAASWSHPASPLKARKSTAATARLSMYSVMLEKGRPGSGATGTGRTSGGPGSARSSMLHKAPSGVP